MSQRNKFSSQNNKNDSRHSLPPTLYTIHPKHPPHYAPYSQNYRTRPYSVGQTQKYPPYNSQHNFQTPQNRSPSKYTQSTNGLLHTVTHKFTGFFTGMKNAVSSLFKSKDPANPEILVLSQPEESSEMKKLKESKIETSQIQNIDFQPLGEALAESLKRSQYNYESNPKASATKNTLHVQNILNTSVNTDALSNSNMGNISMNQDNKNILNFSSNSGNKSIEGSTFIRKKEKKFSLIKKLNYCLDFYEEQARQYVESQSSGFSKNLKAVLTEKAEKPVPKRLNYCLIEFRYNRTLDRFDAVRNKKRKMGDMELESLNNSQSRGLLGDTSLELERSGFSQLAKRNKKNSLPISGRGSPMPTNKIVVEMQGYHPRSSITIQNKNQVKKIHYEKYDEEELEDETQKPSNKKKTPMKNPIFEEDKCNRSTDTDSESIHFQNNPKRTLIIKHNSLVTVESSCQTSPHRTAPAIQSSKMDSSPKLSRQNTEKRILPNLLPGIKEESKSPGRQTPERLPSNSDIHIKVEENSQSSAKSPGMIKDDTMNSFSQKSPDIKVEPTNNKPAESKTNFSLLTNSASSNQGIVHNSPKPINPEKKPQAFGNFFMNSASKIEKPVESKESNQKDTESEKKIEPKPIEKIEFKPQNKIEIPNRPEEKKEEVKNDTAANSKNVSFLQSGGGFKLNYVIGQQASDDKLPENPFLKNRSAGPANSSSETKPNTNDLAGIPNPFPTKSQSLTEEKPVVKGFNLTGNLSTQPIKSDPIPSNPTMNLFSGNKPSDPQNLHKTNLFSNIKNVPVGGPITQPPISNPIIPPVNYASSGMEIIETGGSNSMKSETNPFVKKNEMANEGMQIVPPSNNMFQNPGTNNLFSKPSNPINIAPQNPFVTSSGNPTNNLFAHLNRNPNPNPQPLNNGMQNTIFPPSNPSGNNNIFQNLNRGSVFPPNNNSMRDSSMGNAGMNVINSGGMNDGSMEERNNGTGNLASGGGMMGINRNNTNLPVSNPFTNKISNQGMGSDGALNTSFGKPSEIASNFLGLGNGNNQNNGGNNNNTAGRNIRKIMAPSLNKDRSRAFSGQS